MSADLTDLFMLQLAQQASLYDLSFMKDRRRSSERVAAFFLKTLELLPVSVCMEIGAHEATFSRKAKNARPDIIARAFEANPHVYAHFMFDKELGELGVDYRHRAVGNVNGVTEFHIYESVMGQPEPVDSRRQSCLLRADSPEASHYAIKAPIATLDAVCARDGEDARYALWIDAEGFGKQVLDGAKSVLDRTLAIYIELESIGKFDGQALDREIISFLLERDFIPILRDFQFNHQYNVIFVKKGSMPLVEHEWHRYFQAVLRKEFSNIFGVAEKQKDPGLIPPPRLSHMHFNTTNEFREILDSLPLLRMPADGIDPARTVVACHISDFEEAQDFYKAKCRKPPQFYVTGIAEDESKESSFHEFSELFPGMKVQLFFKPNPRPDHTWFAFLTRALADRGVDVFYIEKYCVSSFWQRNFRDKITDHDMEAMRAFFNLLSDPWSQYTYLAICHANMTGQPGYIPVSRWPQYNHPLVHAEPGDIICEGGLEFFRSGGKIESTTLDFYNALNGDGVIYGFEPVSKTYDDLLVMCKDKPGIFIENKALWSHGGVISISGIESPNCAHTMEAGAGDDKCPCVSIDGFFADKQPPTLIKLDVEGAEPEILKGARETMLSRRPKLMAAIYHARSGPDWATVPNILMDCGAGYEFFCGHHTPWYAESFVYGRKSE